MFAKLKLFVTAALLVAASSIAAAADYYVEITNQTGYTIMYMYVSPAKSDSWEEDVLGKEVLANGETRRVNLTGYRSPIFATSATRDLCAPMLMDTAHIMEADAQHIQHLIQRGHSQPNVPAVKSA